LRGGLVLLTIAVVGCYARVQTIAPPSRAQNLDRALANATRFLTERQSADGTWRSEVYGTFRQGDALTPLVLDALQSLPPDPERTTSIRKGLDYLTSLEPRAELNYPTYTAALAVVVLGRSEVPEHRRARDGWLSFRAPGNCPRNWGGEPTTPRSAAGASASHRRAGRARALRTSQHLHDRLLRGSPAFGRRST
jgi:hypothetical protein